MDDEGGVVHYDAAAGTLRLRLEGGEEVTIAGLRDPSFRSGGGTAPLSIPLWLNAKQADVLSKMIGYILERVNISPSSRQVLDELRPILDDHKAELDSLAESELDSPVESAAE